MSRRRGAERGDRSGQDISATPTAGRFVNGVLDKLNKDLHGPKPEK
jgi:hypothetical protein